MHYYDSGNQSVYLWFKKDGVGNDPTGTGTGFFANVLSADTATDVAKKSLAAINGGVTTQITTVDGSSVPAGGYFEFTAKTSGGTQKWVVWYTVGGAGTQPIVSGAEYIRVDIESNSSDEAVAELTIDAINSEYVAIPDLRGKFIRGWNNGSGNDPSSGNRYASPALLFGVMLLVLLN